MTCDRYLHLSHKICYLPLCTILSALGQSDLCSPQWVPLISGFQVGLTSGIQRRPSEEERKIVDPHQIASGWLNPSIQVTSPPKTTLPHFFLPCSSYHSISTSFAHRILTIPLYQHWDTVWFP